MHERATVKWHSFNKCLPRKFHGDSSLSIIYSVHSVCASRFEGNCFPEKRGEKTECPVTCQQMQCEAWTPNRFPRNSNMLSPKTCWHSHIPTEVTCKITQAVALKCCYSRNKTKRHQHVVKTLFSIRKRMACSKSN